MKKFLALLLAALMLLTMTAAFADDEPAAVAPSTTEGAFTKKFEGAIPTTETLTFKTEFVKGTVNGVDITPDIAVVPATIELPLNGTHDDGVFEVPFTVTAPSSYGTYIYKIVEDATSDPIANVTYDTDALYIAVIYTPDTLNVTLINDPTVATTDLDVSDRAVDTDEDEKKDQFVNSYKTGSFNVKKTITGNASNEADRFVVVVTFTSTVDEDLKNLAMTVISSAWTEAKTVPVTELAGKGTATYNIEIGHNETYTFENVPVGVEINVTETNQVGMADLNYYSDSYENNDLEVGETAQTITITNTKIAEIPTGIELDSIPYIVLMAVAVLGLVGFFVKRRLAAADED